MRRHLRKIVLGLGILGVALLLALPSGIDTLLNRVSSSSSPASPTPRAERLHERSLIVDLHADPLLWGRDLLTRHRRGQVDVPRLVEGNVTLQVFGVVTKTPWGLNFERNDDRSDMLTLLAVASRWPPRTWGSLLQRALYQADRLRDMADRSGGRLRLITTAAELDDHLAQRARGGRTCGALLAIEGAHALEGDPDNLDALYDAGIRMISPSHFFDTEMGGSAHGVAKGGLTEPGRELIRRMEERGVVLDLSHASPQTFDEALALATRPVVVSHTGVRATCPGPRNLSDDQLRAVSANGGVVGIGFFPGAVCGSSVEDIVKAIRHAADVAGVEHVGLGSDFDGAVTTPIDSSQLVLITDALLRAGFDEKDVAQIMGGNALRVLREVLP